VPVINGPFVVEPSVTQPDAQALFLNGLPSGPYITEVMFDRLVTENLYIRGTDVTFMIRDTASEYNLGGLNHILFQDMLVGTPIIPAKQINELDFVSSEKQIKLFGSVTREYWF